MQIDHMSKNSKYILLMGGPNVTAVREHHQRIKRCYRRMGGVYGTTESTPERFTCKWVSIPLRRPAKPLCRQEPAHPSSSHMISSHQTLTLFKPRDANSVLKSWVSNDWQRYIFLSYGNCESFLKYNLHYTLN